MKPNCYNCRWRGTVPGSAHSSCTVLRPGGTETPESAKLEILIAAQQVAITNKETGENLVKLDEHGVKMGWASWPIDFDPIWVESCAFETPKDKKE